jgi:Zinc finger, C2H2 type
MKNKPSNFKIQLGKPVSKTTTPSKSVPIKAPKMKEKKEKEEMIPLESYFYGIYDGDQWNSSAAVTKFDTMCPECPTAFTKNVDLMDHLYKHANIGQNQCRYCVEVFKNKDALKKHIAVLHPLDTKNALTAVNNCIICEVSKRKIPARVGLQVLIFF